MSISKKLAGYIDDILGYTQADSEVKLDDPKMQPKGGARNTEALSREYYRLNTADMSAEKISSLNKKHMNLINKHIEHNSDKSNEQKKSLHITYKKLNGRTVKRKIDPYVLKNNLLIGFDHKRKATRSFKLDRFKDLKKTAFYNGFEKKAYEWSGTNEFPMNTPTVKLKRDKDEISVPVGLEGRDDTYESSF